MKPILCDAYLFYLCEGKVVMYYDIEGPENGFDVSIPNEFKNSDDLSEKKTVISAVE